MSKLLKYFYKIMYDDVKDSEMLLEYASHAKECGMTDVAKYFATEAMTRLTKSYKEVHTMFHNLMEKENIHIEKDPMGCLVEHMLDELEDWRISVVKRLEKM